MNKEELINDWNFRVYRMQISHFKSAEHFRRMHQLLGVPVVALSAIVGTTIFVNLQQQSNSSVVQVVAGMLSVLAAVLASLQTFNKYSERATEHHVAGAKYAGLRMELQKLSVFMPLENQELNEFLESFRVRWVSLAEQTTTVPKRIFDKIRAEMDKNPEQYSIIRVP